MATEAPTEPSAVGALIVYGVPAITIGVWLGEVGFLGALVIIFTARGFSGGPLFRSKKLDENELIYGKSARLARDKRIAEEGLVDANKLVQQTWKQAVAGVIGPLFGIPFVAVIVLSVLAALLGPGSCNSRDNSPEYRAL